MNIDKDIAIVGISCRFPGGCDTQQKFWQFLENTNDAIIKTPANRIKWPEYIDINGRENHLDLGGYLNNIADFDYNFFKVSPREAKQMDPQQRLLLELSWEAIGDAGINPDNLAGSNTAVFVGACNYDYRELLEKNLKRVGAYFTTGTLNCVLSNRVSYFYDLKGPSLSIDTACSSSLVAIHEAVRALRSGETKSALVGAVSLICSATSTLAYYKTGIISKTGRCRTFSDDADGYVRGEGAAFLVLKPLQDAITERNNIYAVIKGSAVNHGGYANTLSSPNPGSQADLIVAAFKDARVTPNDVNFIETHGTGTVIGDPLEIEGLKIAFASSSSGAKLKQNNYCKLGSVKTNLGHLESASGMAGIAKLILAIKNKKVPKNLHFNKLNPHIDLENSPFAIATQATVWEQIDNKPRTAGVSSFGLGGCNAHVVISEYVDNSSVTSDNSEELFIFSASSVISLKNYLAKFIEFLQTTPCEQINLKNLAYTLQVGRKEFVTRFATVANTPQVLLEKIKGYIVYDMQIQNPDSVLEKLAMHWVNGKDFDWCKVWHNKKVKLISAPTYAFERTYCWFDV